MQKGILLVMITALVSGFSIFVNHFAVQEADAFALSLQKNIFVSVILLLALAFIGKSQLRQVFEKRYLKKLALIGLIGGSIPFLLFFYALSLVESAAAAGFIHKTLFVWAGLFAFIFLREKISTGFLVAAGLLFAGNYFFFMPSQSNFFAEGLVFAATILWAAENVLAKHTLKELSGTQVAFGRMFFGAFFMIAMLALFSPQSLQATVSFTLTEFYWAIISSAFLFLFVFTYYNGLKQVPVHIATGILLLAQPITALLSAYFLNAPIGVERATGILFIVLGVILLTGVAYAFSSVKRKVLLCSPEKA